MRVPFVKPDVREADKQRVVEAMANGWLSRGPLVAEFEEALHRQLGLGDHQAVVCTSSCTTALEIALRVLTHPGTEAPHRSAVIVPAVTFPATANVVAHLGYTPVLADVDPLTMMMTPDTAAVAAAQAVEDGLKVRAVMPVHLYGAATPPAPIQWAVQGAAGQPVRVIEDAAHGFGTRVAGQPLGTAQPGGAVCFSFYATKNLTTGEGGALVIDRRHEDTARQWGLHGMTPGAWTRYTGDAAAAHFDVNMPGLKANLTDPQAALGLSQLRRFADSQQTRRTLVRQYLQTLGPLVEDGLIELPAWGVGQRELEDHAWHLFVVKLALDQLQASRDQVIDGLAAAGVGSNVHFDPLFTYDYGETLGWTAWQAPVADRECRRLLSLPLHTLMSEHQVDYVAHRLSLVLRQMARPMSPA